MSRTDVKERKIRGKDIGYKSLNKGSNLLTLSHLFIKVKNPTLEPNCEKIRKLSAIF